MKLNPFPLQAKKVHFNLSVPQLVEAALARQEGRLTSTGALAVETGKYTGRSPNDRFIVNDPAVRDQIDWGPVNRPIAPDKFHRLYADVLAYLKNKELFVFDGFAGADKTYRMPIRVINEYAWHNLFAHQLFLRPAAGELAHHRPEFTVISAPGFEANPAVHGTNSEAFIIISFTDRLVLIGGTKYAGEIKKSIFSVMNYLLPQKNVLSMHCSANQSKDGQVALFFGLSGTGKTTLSADPNRFLIGDDEHGWSEAGIFNIEGGCYAKCINLSAEKEPQIYQAIKFGAVVENVILQESARLADYDDDRLTENTRAAYPVDHIPNALIPGVAAHPKVIVFLTADAFGVLPPIARLSKEQAMYHFLSGYTSKLAGTERGITEPQATFSACFGAPFLPLNPAVYAEMLGKKIDEHQVRVYLVNTGWTGGPYGTGKRMDLPYTRAMITAALNGELERQEFTVHPVFGLAVPRACPGVPAEVLDPRATWPDPAAYDRQAEKLAQLFVDNFQKFNRVSDAIKAAAPKVS
ncbi:MAG TPA: phosphoenolpyruvate carboxykinase (ATP) [Clostridia bacterium]|nr:phosphoenolpyruvate carboxykinase (ATP) [Clostridia bacterium]